MRKLDKYFRNKRLGLELDIYEENGKEWFRVDDIANFFNYDKAQRLLDNLNSSEDHFISVDEMGTGETSANGSKFDGSSNRSYNKYYIDEYALYEVTLRITKANPERYEKAKVFQDWVFGELLPELRKHGGYLDINETDDIVSTLSKVSTILETAAKRYRELTDELFIARKEVECGINSDYDKSRKIEQLESEIQRIKQATKEFIQFKVTEYCNTHDVVEPNNLLDYAKLAREVIDVDVPIMDYILR